MAHPESEGPRNLRDLIGKIADNIELISQFIGQLQQGLSSLTPSAQDATVSPGRIVQLPEHDEGSPTDRTTPPFVPERHYARCVRCDYQWMPRVRRPKNCLCGSEARETLAVRVHRCPECGLVAPRDVVSAQLILRLGRSLASADVA